jgi:hypothetical protein
MWDGSLDVPTGADESLLEVRLNGGLKRRIYDRHTVHGCGEADLEACCLRYFRSGLQSREGGV